MLFLGFALANLAFFAWWRYGPPADAADPAPLKRQIEPEKLKVLGPADLPPPTAAKSEKLGASLTATARCVEWGSFTLADVARAELALEPLALGARLTQRRTYEPASWWVFIPPQGSRQSALKKAAEIKELGVRDYFVVQEEGEHRWAVSLGIYRSEEAAQARLAALHNQGVQDARVGARDNAVPKVWLQVNSVDASLQARLKVLARQIEGSELKECP
ncbi:MAG TPA: SPOR domain-containing protein [Burkholderiales bacterium]|nr:SPOR domain-containing protein [Burkholderiales bacterium]